MSPAIRIVGAVVCLVLVFATSQPGAAPKFSNWAAPTNLGATINSPFEDFGPAISKDGLSLYFNSDRSQGGFGGQDIWVAHRASENDPWGPPVNLGAVINTSFNEAVPALSRDGHWLFFSSNRPNGFGNQDIWVSRREHVHDDFGWEAPVNLGASVNSTAFDAGPSLFENEEGGAPLLFLTSNRPGLGLFDIYVSQLAPNGLFGSATLVPELSSAATEQRPSIRFDGLEIFFYSNRPGSVLNDLWVSTRGNVTAAWSTPVNLGTTVNSASDDQQPYIAADRQTLFFASNRTPGGFGGLDLYVTTRTKNKP